MSKLIHMPTEKFGDRADNVRPSLLIIHSIGLPLPSSLELLVNSHREVSAHYAIAPNGDVYALVPEDKRAWHAGKSSWRGKTDINSMSIGIELVCPGEDGRERDEEEIPGPFEGRQMDTLIKLSKGIAARWDIQPENILGHNDIAPGRKRDPGELFDWSRMAKAGLGLWPKRPLPSGVVGDVAPYLQRYGYDISEPHDALVAFQRHFRPRDCKGAADSETRSILQWLLKKTGR